MEKLFKKIKIVRQTVASGKVMLVGEYTVGGSIKKVDAISLIRSGKAVPLASVGPAPEHREPVVETREPVIEKRSNEKPLFKTGDQFPEDEKIAGAEKEKAKKEAKSPKKSVRKYRKKV